tara:strand:- start:2 stop:295 length:294 start_codon:yes stop_codon:yes gene_type:complete
MDKVWWTNGMRKTLRKRREQLGVTQVEMAKRLKWSQAHFQRHEQGRTDSIDLKVLRKWCAAIELVANYIPAELEIVTKEHHETMMAIDPSELPQEII